MARKHIEHFCGHCQESVFRRYQMTICFVISGTRGSNEGVKTLRDVKAYVRVSLGWSCSQALNRYTRARDCLPRERTAINSPPRFYITVDPLSSTPPHTSLSTYR